MKLPFRDRRKIIPKILPHQQEDFQNSAAIIINPRARKVTKEVIEYCQHFARKQKRAEFQVYIPDSLQGLEEIIQKEVVQKRSGLVLPCGGDGVLYQAWNQTYNFASEAGQHVPPFSILGCGTGNGVAGLVGSTNYKAVLHQLSTFLDKGKKISRLPLKEFLLLRVEGETSKGERTKPLYFTFAGSGLDAEVLNRFNEYKDKHNGLWKGWRGYARAVIMTVFETMVTPWKTDMSAVALRVQGNNYYRYDPHGPDPAEVKISCAPDEDILIDLLKNEEEEKKQEGEADNKKNENEKRIHAVVVGTSVKYGFGFKAFPYARLAGKIDGGKFHVRVVAGSRGKVIFDFLTHIPSLWRGTYCSPYIHDYFLDDFTVEHQGEGEGIPFQIAGEAQGNFKRIRYQKASEPMRVYNALKPSWWRKER